MSKLINQSDQPVSLLHWTVAPKSSRAVHGVTGVIVSQLPSDVAASKQAQRLTTMGLLKDESSLGVAKAPVANTIPVSEQPAKFIKKSKKG